MSKDVSMSRIFKFAGVGILAAAFDYLVYEITVMLIFQGNADMAWASAMISGVLSTFFAYFMHSKITWKERDPGKFGIVKFFIWNFFVVLALRPMLTGFFGLFTGFHQFVFVVVGWIPLFSSFDFVQTTTIYILMTLVTMTLNFIFYEKIVFGTRNKKDGENVDMESVRKSGKEQKAKGKADNSGNK